MIYNFFIYIYRFLFVIFFCGVVNYVFYLGGEDEEVVVLKKGFVLIFVVKLYEEGEVKLLNKKGKY